MKTTLLSIFILLILSSCKNSKNHEVIIQGKVVGKIPEEILYSFPVNGINYEWFNESAPVDSLGNFEISIQIDEPCFISFYLGNRGQLIAEPGNNCTLTIESKDFEIDINYDCYNAEVQHAYQKLESPIHPQFEVMKLWELSPSETKHRIDSLLGVERAYFNEQVNNNVLSSQLFDLIMFDRSLFYTTVLEEVALHHFLAAKRQNLRANTDSINEFWEQTIKRIPLNSAQLLKSKWAYYHIQNYLQFQEYTAENFSWEDRKNARQEERIHSYLIDISKENLSGEVLEFYIASYLLSSANQHKFENELIPLFEDFKSEFPKSKYTAFLELPVEKIVEFQKKSEQEYGEDVRFLDNYEKLNSLDECLKHFEGKKVYVDIWATSCGPCKKEFAFSEELKALLRSANTDILYISTDRESEDQRWKDMIKYYQLNGNHIRVNKMLKDDLRTILGRYGIPRYLLIDENGEIVNEDAPRPSDLDALKKELMNL